MLYQKRFSPEQFFLLPDMTCQAEGVLTRLRVRTCAETNGSKKECEKQESNLRTPTGTDLESASVDHLDILALNNVGYGTVKGLCIQGFYSLKTLISPESVAVSRAWLSPHLWRYCWRGNT